MKITGTGPVRPGATSRPTRKKGDKDEKFSVEASSEEAAPAAVGGPAPLAAVDSLLALQEVPDAATGRSRALLRGQDMLDHLDEIRLGLLMGAIPQQKLSALIQTVRDNRDQVEDPRIAAVLDEIELRAAVELAKLGQNI
jgi:hypothetical protein